MADVVITFKGEADGLKAVIKEVTDANQQISDSAKKAGKDASTAFKETADAAKAAFASGDVKKALDSQIQGVDKLKAGLKELYDEEIKILQAGDKQSKAYQKNQEEAAKLRLEIDKLSRETQAYNKETAKTEKISVSLKTQLKNLKAELSALEQQGKDNTKQFQQTALAAAKLEDQIGDTNERVRVLASDTFKFDAAVGAIQGLSGAFAAAQGAAALFGGESKDLEKSMLKVQAATALLTGVQELANLVTGQGATKIAILSAAQSAYGAVVGSTTGALKVFRLALAGTGIGLLVIGLIELVQNFDKVKKAITSAIPGFEDVADGIGKVIDKTKEFLGIDDGGDKAKQALDALIGAEKRRTNFQVQAIDRRIRLLEAENKDTYELEIEKERIQIESLKRQAKAIKDGTDQLIKLDIDGRKEVRDKADEINAEILDRETTIKILRIQNIRDIVQNVDKLETLGLNKLIEITDKKFEIETKAAEDTKTLRLSVLELEQSLGDKSIENKIAIIRERAKLDAAALGIETEDSIKRQKIYADAENEITRLQKEETQKRIESIFEYANAISSTFSSLNELSKQQTENRIADIQAQSAVELAAINSTFETERKKNAQRAALDAKTKKQVAAEKNRQAKQDKALALFQAIIGSAAAVASAKTIPLKIIAAIAGAAQIAIIASKPVPKFEKGGAVGGKRHSQGGTLIEAEEGEFITNRRQSAKHRSALEAMNKSSEAFKAYIDKNYVRPAVMNYVLSNKRNNSSINVNATLNSASMEHTLNSMHKTMKKQAKQSFKHDTRYAWHNN